MQCAVSGMNVFFFPSPSTTPPSTYFLSLISPLHSSTLFLSLLSLPHTPFLSLPSPSSTPFLSLPSPSSTPFLPLPSLSSTPFLSLLSLSPTHPDWRIPREACLLSWTNGEEGRSFSPLLSSNSRQRSAGWSLLPLLLQSPSCSKNGRTLTYSEDYEGGGEGEGEGGEGE